MKKILSAVVLLMSIMFLKAQTPGAIPNIGHIYGKIIDSVTGKPISDVSVILLQNRMDTATKKRKDFLLKGMNTKTNGEFSLSDLPIMGQLKLKISAIGYKPVEKAIAFQMSGGLNAIDKDLGNIGLANDAKSLEGVTVVASKPFMKLDIDKKVFNVEKNLVSAGGTALDVMRNVPSVQVDIDGSVKLRNAPPQIYIDGRPTTLSLDQIPADAIESVEVITNPSAKYDASGGNAGILNIVLKKNKKKGYNGNVMAGVDRRGALNGMGSFNLRQDKFNFSTTLFGSQFKNRSEGTTERLNLLGMPQTLVNQHNNNKTNGGFLFGRMGIDYFLTNRTTLSVAGIIVNGKFKPEGIIDIVTDSLFNSGKISQFSNRISNSTTEFNAKGLQFGMKHNFKKAGEELTADFNYFSSTSNGNDLNTTNYLNNTGGLKNLTQQKITRDGNNKNMTIQTDYVNPITDKIKLETGLRAQINNVRNNNELHFRADNNGNFILLPSGTSNYKDANYVYAAYATFSQSIKSFGYKVGLRAERSNYAGELKNTGQKFSNDYPISLFPSVFLSQKLKNKQELQLSYTRRITRPGFNQIIPYTDYSDSLNIRRGNPALVPQFTNSIEASYSKTFKGNNSLLFSVYYKQSTDLITSYLIQDINPATGNNDIINTYINANSSYSTGAEITAVNKLTKWWDITTNVNVYNSKINTDNIIGASQDARWSWFGKFNSNFKLPKKFTAQLSVNYQSKTNLAAGSGGGMFGGGSQSQAAAQGYIKAYWATDVAIKKAFLKNDAASLTLSFSDIFKTRKVEQHSQSSFFIQDYSQLNNPQMVRLTFTYRFGKFDASLFKRQNAKSQQEGMQGAMEGMKN
jgi:ferric enterobactin receptor